MKKTSIYLPSQLISDWKREHRAILVQLPKLLQKAHQFQPTRERLRQYRYYPAGGTIISVYWPLSVYNRLHCFASAVRVSVSLLITYLLHAIRTRKKTEPVLLNYAFDAIQWNENRMAFREELHFFTIPPPLTP